MEVALLDNLDLRSEQRSSRLLFLPGDVCIGSAFPKGEKIAQGDRPSVFHRI